jgi:hypothetical protein
MCTASAPLTVSDHHVPAGGRSAGRSMTIGINSPVLNASTGAFGPGYRNRGWSICRVRPTRQCRFASFGVGCRRSSGNEYAARARSGLAKCGRAEGSFHDS